MAINLGDINFGLAPDTRTLRSAHRDVLRFGQAVNKAAADQSEGARRAEQALRRQEKALVDTLNKVLKLNDQIRGKGVDPRYINDTTRLFERLVREVGRGQVSALQFQRSMEDVAASMGRTQRAIDQNVRRNEALAKSQRDAARAAQAQIDWTVKAERALNSAKRTVDAFNASVARTKAPSSLASNATGALNAFMNPMMQGKVLDPVAFNRASQAFQNAMNKNTIALRNFQRHGDQSAVANSLERLANISILLHGPLSGIASRFALIASLTDKVSLKTAALVSGISAAAFAFVRMGENAIAAEKVFQRTELALEAVHGSAQLTAGTMDYLMGIADRSGKSFADVSNMFVRVTAASKGTNLEGERTREIFESILFASSKMGASNEEVAGTLRALEQIMSKGTVQAEELRGQLGDRLPGAFNIMADALGVTTAELGKLMEQGKVTSDALLPFARELAKRYGVDLTTAIDTVTSAEGRATNALLRFGRATDEAIGFTDAYKNVLNGFAEGLDFLGDHLDDMLKIIGMVTGAIVGMYAPAIIGGIIALGNAIKVATLAMLGLNAAVQGNIFVKIATVLASIGLAIGGAVVGYEMMNSILGQTEGSSNEFSEAINRQELALQTATNQSTLFRRELASQIEMQRNAAQAALAEASAQLTAAKAKVDAMRPAHTGGLGEFLFGPGYESLALQDAEKQVNTLTTQSDALSIQLKVLEDQMSRLTNLPEAKIDPLGGSGGGSGGEAAVRRVAKAIREAQQEITKTKAAYDVLLQNPAQRNWLEIQERINQGVQNFTDRLTDAQVPMGMINTLTAQYREQLTLLEEQQYRMQYFPTLWESMAQVIGEQLDPAMDMFLETLVEGGDLLKSLADIGKMVAMDLLKTFTQLAVTNPLKNIFGLGGGQQMPVLGGFGFGGGGGIGDFIGSIFGLGGGGSFASAFGSRIGLPKFAGGGSITIPGGGGGLDTQLVSYYGSPGETMTISKRGHGTPEGGGDIYNSYHIDARGAEVGVEAKIRAALEEYDRDSTRRVQKAIIRGKTHRLPGF